MLRINVFIILSFFVFAGEIHAQAWQKTNGPDVGEINDIYCDKDGNVFACTVKGLCMSKDHGATWEFITAKLGLKNVKSMTMTGKGEWLFLADDHLFKSTNSGKDWASYSTIVNGECVAAGPNDVILAGSTGYMNCMAEVYRSTNAGVSFTKCKRDFACAGIKDIMFCDKGIIIAAIMNNGNCRNHEGGIAVSLDDGKSWDSYELDESCMLYDMVNKFSFDDNTGYIYAATSTGGIFRSKSNGLGFVSFNEGLPGNDAFTTCFVDITDITAAQNGYIIAAGPKGVFLLDLQEDNLWKSFSSGLPAFDEFSITVAEASPKGYVYIANSGSSEIYRSTELMVTGIKDNTLQSYRLDQNYPNPFNPDTHISYSIPEETAVNLAVYDLLGQCVSVLVDEYQSPGEYSIHFSAPEYASGIYFYRLSAGMYHSVKKMSCIK